MSEKVLTDMNYEEFAATLEDYIERSSQQSGEMPASIFFDLLFEKVSKRVTETIELEGRIVGGQLIFSVPAEKEVAVQTRGNQILVGDRRIIVTLKGDGKQGDQDDGLSVARGID